MESLIIDDFKDYNTSTLLGSTSPTPLEKERIFKVFEYLANTQTPNITVPQSETLANMIRNISKTNGSYSEKYDLLKGKIHGCVSNECLLLHVAKIYGLYPKSLLMDTIAIHSRIKKLDTKDTWFDNFSLNNFLLQLTTIVYSDYDKSNDPFVKSVPFSSQSLSGGNLDYENEINYDEIRNSVYKYELNVKSISGGGDNTNTFNQQSKSLNDVLVNTQEKLTNPRQLLFHLGNNYRCFHEFGITAEKVESDEKAVEFLDKLVMKYPYFTGCTHGCDVFTPNYRDKSVSIKDISEFCKRYPKTIVGYILNTQTYASGKGQHWVALLFKNFTCYMICSQACTFSSFHESSLIPDLNKCGFAREWNNITIQYDHSSCGLYSVLANLCFILNGAGNRKPDIKKIVEMIGKEGKNINSDGIYVIKKKLAGYKK